MGLSDTHPRVSVVVRSYNRLPALVELLQLLLVQDHDSFEIVVVEQSTDRPPADVAQLDALARDARLRILSFAPLGGPCARNTGVRAARGELLVFIDDDDLPASADWLRLHEANFSDPLCLGVTGQFVEDGKPYVNLERARRQVLSFNVLKWQRVFARTDVRKRVESLMGGNAAIPRRTLERFGMWDECTPIEDEPSLAYRIGAARRRVLAVRSGAEDDPPARRAGRHGEAHDVGAALRQARVHVPAQHHRLLLPAAVPAALPGVLLHVRLSRDAVDLLRQHQAPHARPARVGGHRSMYLASSIPLWIVAGSARGGSIGSRTARRRTGRCSNRGSPSTTRAGSRSPIVR